MVSWEDAHKRIAELERECERVKALLAKYVAHDRDNWKQVCESEVFHELKHGKYRGVMQLLQDGEISIGKAAQAISEIAHGVTPVLPDYELREDEPSWKERATAALAVLREIRDDPERYGDPYPSGSNRRGVADGVMKCALIAKAFLERKGKVENDIH